MAENKDNKVQQNLKTSEIVKCKQCGADMVYDIKIGKLKCPYCKTSEDVGGNVFEEEHDLDNFDESTLKHEDGSFTYQCPNCYAKTIMHEYTTSAKCPFCGATNIVSVQELPGILPDAILPFKVTKETAAEYSTKWIKKKFFAPRKLKKAFKAEKLNGLYAPVFTFDSSTFSSYDGRLGKHYTVTVGSGKSRRTVTRTRWFHINGTYNRDFDDVLVEASNTLNQKQINCIGSFDTGNALEYNKEYIAGLASERHDIGVGDAFNVAKDEMKNLISEGILSGYNYDVVGYLNVKTKYNDNTFKHLLVPLWCCSYKYNKKDYRYFVNGRTGQVGGKTPISIIKVIGVALIIIAIIFLIWYFFFR